MKNLYSVFVKTIYVILFTAISVSFSYAQPANDNCANATLLTAGSSCSYMTYVSTSATAEATSVAANPSCGFYKGGDVWFKVEMPESGALRIQIVNVTNNLQYAVYTGSCGSFTQIACLQNTANYTINNPSLAEEMIYIRVYNYNSTAGGTFQLCVWEPPVPANDNCADAIPIMVNSTCTPDTFTNAYATAQATSVAANPSCGFYKGGDVWFTLEMPESGSLRIERANISGVNAQYALYSGSCGSFTQIACAQLSTFIQLLNPSLAEDIISQGV